jgi:chemotaxis protein CheD
MLSTSPAATVKRPPVTGLSVSPGAAIANAAMGTRTERLTRLKARQPKPGEASFFFFDAHFQSEAVKILPGEYFVFNEDLLIMTTLGSCIAVCLWDRNAKVGGADNGRYGSFAMELLINEMMKMGASRMTMEAKVFGGGAVISGMNSINVGERNTEFVMGYLKTERIPVVSKDVLDIYPRKVCFLPGSGKAMVKRLAASNPDAIVQQERAAAQKVAPTSSGAGSIDLF